MAYADNDFKFVAVINRKIEMPRLMNALAHMASGLIAQTEQTDTFRFLRYEYADGTASQVSHYPWIILESKNGSQLRTLRQAAQEQGILTNVFTDSMLGASAQDQMDKTKSTPEEGLEYFVVCLFGAADEVTALTKKFSLFKGS